MKFLSTFFFAFFLYFTGFSQGFHFGIGAGANYTDIINKNYPYDFYSYGLGFQINTLFEYELCDKMSLRAEPGFESRRVDDNPSIGNNSSTFNYVTLPAMLTFSPTAKFTFMAGPEIAYVLTSPFKLSNEALQIVGGENQNFDLGIKAGVSYNISENFELAFKYYRGIRPSGQLNITDMNGSSIGYNAYYQGFSLGAFYRI